MKALIVTLALTLCCFGQDLQSGTLLGCTPETTGCYEHLGSNVTTRPLYRVRTTDTEYVFIRKTSDSVYGEVLYRVNGDLITVFSGRRKLFTRHVLVTQPYTPIQTTYR
jgi:hypothetical protein